MHSGAALTAISTLPSATWAAGIVGKSGGADEIIRNLSQLIDREVPILLKRQVNRPGNRWDGGIADIYDLPNVHSTKDFIVVAGSAYVSEYSEYYLSPDLEQPLEMAASCLLNVQYDDGTIDLHSTNFHSTPDTAFLVNDLGPLLICLK